MLSYKTQVIWKGEHWGHLTCSNGTEMDFSAPPALHGHPGVMTPEDAFVAAVNTCFHMMFIWVVEKLRLNLISYECEAEGFVEDRLDKTSIFNKVVLRPRIVAKEAKEEQIRKAIQVARKYSLIAESIKSELIIQPEIVIQS
ncbi:MAG TPA: OsmC family protein [Thermodesulfobacteriota bacterium]|nr:OsmC family protein [Thermodesulfobacteriota bacterium]